MREIYVVMGSTGEYSDHNEWPVKAFFKKDAAEVLVIEATTAAKQIEINGGGGMAVRHSDPGTYINQFDPNMKMDYTGTEYYYMAVSLEELSVEAEV